MAACWYLNYIKYGEDWDKFYHCDADVGGVSEQQKKDLLLGGQACLWGEYVDGTNVLSRMWPRASAVAERLWSNREDTKSTNDARYRLDDIRCHMLKRGIPAQPILMGSCDYNYLIEESDNQRLDDPGAIISN